LILKTKKERNREKARKYIHSINGRVLRKAYDKKYWPEVKMRIYTRLGNKCASCGCKDRRILQFDHLKDNGYLQRKQLGPRSMLLYILKHPEEFQLLCANCNWIKRRIKEGRKEPEVEP